MGFFGRWWFFLVVSGGLSLLFGGFLKIIGYKSLLDPGPRRLEIHWQSPPSPAEPAGDAERDLSPRVGGSVSPGFSSRDMPREL